MNSDPYAMMLLLSPSRSFPKSKFYACTYWKFFCAASMDISNLKHGGCNSLCISSNFPTTLTSTEPWYPDLPTGISEDKRGNVTCFSHVFYLFLHFAPCHSGPVVAKVSLLLYCIVHYTLYLQWFLGVFFHTYLPQ